MDASSDRSAPKGYWLLGPDGQKYESKAPGTLGGNAKAKIYGRLDCGSALASIRDHGASYTQHRVFFSDEDAAIAAGYRPCGNCMRDRFVAWKNSQEATWPAVNDLRWWRKSPIATPAENTAATDKGYGIATDLGLGEDTGVWQLPLRDGEVLRLLFEPSGGITGELIRDLRDALSDGFQGLDVTLASTEPITGVKVGPAAIVASFSLPKTSSVSLDAFDLLGVSRREDSYTTLIGRAFALDVGFRAALLQAFGVPAAAADDWMCRLRVGVTSEADKRSVPDLVFFSRKARELVIVEAKIDAGEGDGQLRRYAEPSPRAELCSRLGLDAPVESQRGFFLTLDGAPLRSTSGLKPWFKPLRWTAVAEAAEAATRPDTVGLLLRELAARIREHEAWPAPEPSSPVLRYLTRRPRLVTKAVVFRRLLDAIQLQGEGFVTSFGHTANPGCGDIPLCKWSKPSWERPASNADPGTSVHFELQWNTESNGLTIYLHCETNPYLSQKDLMAQRGKAALKAHAEVQARLFAELDRRRKVFETAGWSFRRGYNMLASYKLPSFIRVEDFHARLRDLIRVMAAVVDRWAQQRAVIARG
ncbi:Ada metal-binding domain-containing protein [Sorangium sp. So ce388]|uniref:Ada metal-binding domain-containing protein n=1 Tax=Sorangium sp. So ce388 TaxID=3133309 RepID=UPI003F5AFA32